MLALAMLFIPMPSPPAQEPSTDNVLVKQIADSGRCADIGETPDQRVTPDIKVAPGQPPVLSFRLYEGKQHHRFGNAELLLDDAGH